jgi:hypothetical protein
MKVTKYMLVLCSLLLLNACDDDDKIFTGVDGNFARFFLVLNANGEPIEAPLIAPGFQVVTTYTKSNVKTIKIPVTLTTTPLTDDVTIDFETVLSGISNVSIEPQSQLRFSGTQLIDTIYVTFTERWDPANNPSLKFTLTQASNPTIILGLPGAQQLNKELTVNLTPVNLEYGITSPSRVDVSGVAGETYDLVVGFPNGYVASELEPLDLLQETQSNYSYTRTRLPLTASDKITYRFSVTNDLTDPDELYRTSLALLNIPNYELNGNPLATFIRQPVTPRNIALNTASNFYNIADSNFRLFGVNWMDSNANGTCTWTDFNSFTVPVIVPETDPNAILGSDMGTADPSDDVYYHAFRIGFRSPNAVTTTNPFNLKRWFTNEASNADVSPGFNIVPAIEFFPENGTSATGGTIQIIDQTLQVSALASGGGARAFIQISGTGTYNLIAPGIYELIFTLNASNSRLFGGTRAARYHMYTTSNFTDPANLSEGCFVPVTI